jgi:hypothetical protein
VWKSGNLWSSNELSHWNQGKLAWLITYDPKFDGLIFKEINCWNHDKYKYRIYTIGISISYLFFRGQ